MKVRPLDEADYGYALFTWREGHHKAPGFCRTPWSYYKDTVAPQLEKLLDEGPVLGAYTDDGKLIGWLAMSRGKRVHTLHWVHVKHELDGERIRRHGVMTALIDAADLGRNFVYTLQGRRLERDARPMKSLDEPIVASLRARGVTATYVPLKEWLK